MPVLVPMLASVAVALWIAWKESSPSKIPVDVCVRQLRTEMSFDGRVLDVRSESTGWECSRIVVECSDLPEVFVPPEFGGYPVRIQLKGRLRP